MTIPLEKLLDKRSLKSGRKSDCVLNFYEKRTRADKLMTYAHKSKKRELIAEANNHFVIAIVTAFEVYIVDLINELINKNKINPTNLKIISKRDYSMKDVIFVIKNKITAGEIYCNAMNFENPKDLEVLLSSLFGVEFFDYLRNHVFRYLNTRSKQEQFVFEKDFQDKLSDIFENRHKIVHDITFKRTPTIKELKKMGDLMTKFVHAIEIMANQFRDNRTCEIVRIE